MKRLLAVDFVRFCLVGATGFLVNFLLLTLLYKQGGLNIFVAQLIAAEIALFSNFILHHNWTYKKSSVTKTIERLLVEFHITSWVAIIGSALLISAGVNLLGLNYIVALIISSIIALGWNYLWTRYVIWRKQANFKTEVRKT